jgi:hypothetical protein
MKAILMVGERGRHGRTEDIDPELELQAQR